jgi:hypothetical protein
VLVIRALYPRLAPADAAGILVPHHHQYPAGVAASDGAAAPHPPR